MRRLIVSGIALTVALASTAAARAAPVDPRPPRITEQLVDAVDGPANDQRVQIDTTLLVPAGAAANRRVPAVILAHGLNLDKRVTMSQARQLAAHGLIVLAYSARGHGRSTGAIGLDDPDYDGKDVRRLVDWLAERPEVQLDRPGDPRVGISGGSYGGAIALIAAGLDNRIDAVVAEQTWGDLPHALAPNDDAVARASGVGGPIKKSYLDLLFPSPCRLVADKCGALDAARAAGYAVPQFVSTFGRSSPVALADRIRAPVLLVQGERDTMFPLDESVTTFDRVKSAGASEVSMIWEPGGHGYASAPEVRDVASLDPKDVIATRVLAWFDLYIKGQRQVAPGVQFTWWDTGRSRWRTSPSYPILGERVVPLSLAGSGTFANPADGQPASYTETPLRMGDPAVGGRSPSDPPGQSVTLASLPLDQDADVIGIPRLTIRLGSASGELVVFVKLFDVAPDGRETMIPRDVAAVRLTGAGGEPADRTIDLRGVAHTVRAGHRLKVVVASTDSNFGARAAADTYTVAGPSRLQLAVLPNRSHTGGPLAVALGAALGLVLLAIALIATRATRAARAQAALPAPFSLSRE